MKQIGNIIIAIAWILIFVGMILTWSSWVNSGGSAGDITTVHYAQFLAGNILILVGVIVLAIYGAIKLGQHLNGDN